MNNSLVQQRFGINAENYVNSPSHAKSAELDELIAQAKPQPNWRMLDVATGGGHTAFAFAPYVAEVVASDVTDEMLAAVERQITERGLANVSTAFADAQSLPMPDASFDFVTCRVAAHHFDNVSSFIGEARRVARPGGILGLIDMISPSPETTPGFSDDELMATSQIYNRFEQIRDPSHVRALTVGEWKTTLERKGFSLRSLQITSKAMPFELWCHNQSVEPDTAVVLEDMLRSATGAFRAFIQPHDEDDKLHFKITSVTITAKAT